MRSKVIDKPASGGGPAIGRALGLDLVSLSTIHTCETMLRWLFGRRSPHQMALAPQALFIHGQAGETVPTGHARDKQHIGSWSPASVFRGRAVARQPARKVEGPKE